MPFGPTIQYWEVSRNEYTRKPNTLLSTEVYVLIALIQSTQLRLQKSFCLHNYPFKYYNNGVLLFSQYNGHYLARLHNYILRKQKYIQDRKNRIYFHVSATNINM